MGVVKFAKLMLSLSLAELDPHLLHETSFALPKIKFIPLHVIKSNYKRIMCGDAYRERRCG